MIIALELSRRQYDGINALKSKEKLVGRVKRKLNKQNKFERNLKWTSNASMLHIMFYTASHTLDETNDQQIIIMEGC